MLCSWQFLLFVIMNTSIQIFCKLHGKETRVEQSSHWASVTPYCLAVHLPAGVITTEPWEERFTP